MEERYSKRLENSGHQSSLVAFGVLFFINVVFCYLEFRAFGVNASTVPLYGYLVSAFLALVNIYISLFGKKSGVLTARLLGNVGVSMILVTIAAYTQEYASYHALELTLLIVWVGSLNSVRFFISTAANIVFVSLFLSSLLLSETSDFRTSLAAVFLITATVLAGYLSYLLERQRRLSCLRKMLTNDMNSRQASWAVALIDLDAALNGINDFKQVMSALKTYLEPVISFESCALTTLEEQGSKPMADDIGGDLAENEGQTIWRQDLLDKLQQTRQASASAEHETVKGFMGTSRDVLISYRLDVPVFDDATLMGVVSLCRANKPFDDLDMIAGVSIATQAILIYKRAPINSALVNDTTTITALKNDQVMAPSDLIKRIKTEEASSKKTIILLSREDADKVAIDQYRAAAANGESLSILIVEVDGLSKLREQDGGRAAYQVFAAIIKYVFSRIQKEKDILGRYDQNSLSILMPMIDMNAAEKFAEKIRAFVAGARYRTAYGEKSATLSIGVASITDEAEGYGSMLKRADMALFVAKKSGRNCVKVRL